MAVYTKVSTDEARAMLQQRKLGELRGLQGCAGGIENTNYFVNTELEGQRFDYVLTVFERLSLSELPFYLRLMKHLAQRGIPVPEPHADAQGDLLFQIKGKPAALVNRLRGASELNPKPLHCAAVGAMLARMHLAGRDFSMSQPNLRGLAWWNETVPALLAHLSPAQTVLIRAEMAYQNHIAASSTYAALPRGPIHADLFRDNVMFENVAGEAQLAGFFDFYFAAVGSWLFDLAVALNDWSIDRESGLQLTQNVDSFMAAYSAVRPLERAERALLPALLRAAALRFWVSRLWDYHMPRPASLLKAHDPRPFERLLRQRATDPDASAMLASLA